MTSPLQIISVSDRERTTIIYQTYTRDSVAGIHQQKERVSPSRPSSFNDLAPRRNGRYQNQEWSTNSHILLPNYLLDQIDLLRQNRKRMYAICTINENYPRAVSQKNSSRVWLRFNPVVWKSGGMYSWSCRARILLEYSDSNVSHVLCYGSIFNSRTINFLFGCSGIIDTECGDTWSSEPRSHSRRNPSKCSLLCPKKEKTTISRVLIT